MASPIIFNQGPMIGVKYDYHRLDYGTPIYNVGFPIEDSLGRKFRYTKVSSGDSDLVVANLLSPDFSDLFTIDIDNLTAVAAIGSRTVVVTSATIGSATKDQYSGCLFCITDGVGKGYEYEILSNTVAASNVVTFTLARDLKVALTAASDIMIAGNRWNHQVIFDATGGSDEIISGVSKIATTNSANSRDEWCFVQTAGPCMVLFDLNTNKTVAVGDWVCVSDGVDGACQLNDAHAEMSIGQAMQAADTNLAHVLINLKLE